MTRQACKRGTILVALTVLICSTSFGQLSTGFTASQVSGCAPIVVQFTDQSTGNPSSWRWELGNGVVSHLQNPSTTYFNPGTYSVKLVIKSASGADSLKKTSYITVFPNPTVSFTASDTSGCFPFRVQFTDQTVPNSSGITSWEWDFGDGSISGAQNPEHVYTAAGNYTVTLKVTNSNGCVKTLSKTAYIKTTFGVEADFVSINTFQCKAPSVFHFTNLSKGPGTLTYLWDFGDGSQSNVQAPSYQYTRTGSYTVRLIAISPQGCRDTIVKQNYINIGTTPQYTAPASVCEDRQISLSNTTVPSPASMKWFFGDGTSSTDAYPTKVYSTPGLYFIKLVNDYNGCKDSVSRPITVFAKPNLNFAVSRNTFCKTPFTVNFTGQTAGITSYQWNFGDGGTSTAANPTHTYNSYGGFDVTLIVTNQNGCTDTIFRPGFIEIRKPIITINGLPATGCNPLTVNPRAVISSYDPVVSYLWDFGNGVTSTQKDPTYTYTVAGNYDVKLTITTAGGCTETVVINRGVRVGNKPKAGFTVYPPVVCVSQNVLFTDTSTGDVDQWLWDFGGDYSSDQNPVWNFTPGYVNVTLTVWSNTCPDSVHIDSVVFVKPPVSEFFVKDNCTDKYTKTFTDNSNGATSYFWKFGDGTTSTQKSPVHTYAAPGKYKVEFTVFNDTCQHWSMAEVLVIDEKSDFTLTKEVCKNTPANFQALGINQTNISSWKWYFGDGEIDDSSGASATHIYKQAGTYLVTLKIVDLLGCANFKTDTIRVYGPTAGFTPNVTVSCYTSNSILFNDSSAGDGIHPVVKWAWNFGDGTTDTSGVRPISHQYNTPGSYQVSLTVTDNFGCTDSFVNPAALVIAQPEASFFSADTLTCTANSVSFQNQSTGDNLTYHWTLGDGSHSTIDNPVHYYSAVGSYSVKLKVTDQNGCTDSLTRTNYINVHFPKASFLMSDTVGSCPPMMVNFTNKSTHYASLRWDFGDGNTSTLENPSHYYTTAGDYYIKLVATSQGGCVDSVTRKLVVKGPRGTFTYNSDEGCKPLGVSFTAQTFNRQNIIWDFSDGTTVTGTDSVITHFYTEPGEYVPRMILTDAAGCSVPVQGPDTIKVIGIVASVSLNASGFCDSGNAVFTNSTVSNDLITGWHWDFGDSTTSTDPSPSHFYAKPGTYNARLSITTARGCIDSSALIPVTVHTSPVISINGDNSACAPANLQFSGSTSFANALSWNWSMGNGQTSTEQTPPAQTYQPGNYSVTVTATDVNGCSDTEIKQVTVHALPVVNAGADALVCEGSSLRLNATGASTYTWASSQPMSCINCPDPLVSPADTSVFVVTGFNAAGCSAKDSVKLNVRHPFILTESPDQAVCFGESVKLISSGADQYSWSPSSGLDHTNIASPVASPSSTTTYQLIAKDNDNCFADTAQVVVTVNPLPTVEAGPDQTLSVGSNLSLKTKSSSNVTAWSWTPPYTLSCASCPEPVAKPRNTTTYRVDVTTAAGCKSYDELTVNVICNNGNLFIPNTFSPNNDGMNDKFYPRGTGIARIKSFRVFDRWGEVVFERINFNANDPNDGWDGTYKGKKLAPDVFIYTCEVICENSIVLPFKGDVTLIQ